jgi:hypothetical protein
MRPNIASRLEPTTPTLQDLVNQINEGEVKIPAFQRRFVWKDHQALDLLDSLASNYPVGSLLLWRTKERLVTERNIGDFRLPDTDDQSPTDYVLDGQQRLTVIYSCLGASELQPGFSAGYNLRREEFTPLPDKSTVHVFPLRIIFDTSRLLDFRTALQVVPDREELQARLDGLVKVLTGYRLPVVTLKNLNLDEVCPIFERINSSGTRLSIYDLMVAATWSRSFDLNERTRSLAQAVEGKDFDSIEGTTLLKVFSAIAFTSTERKGILSLRDKTPSELDDLVARAKGGLERAIDFLCTDLKVHSLDFLPYEAHLVILARVFADASALSDSQVARLRQWFWRSAFSEHYRGASDSFVTRSLKSVVDFVMGTTEASGVAAGGAEEYGGVPTPRSLLRLTFRKNGAGSRAFALAMAKRGPQNLTNGAHIDTYAALSVYNRHQFHHIYPLAFLKRQKIEGDPNSLMNICMLAASENNKISDDDPARYMRRIADSLGEKSKAVFASNFVPHPDEFTYTDEAYRQFLFDRACLASDWVGGLCRGDY